MSRPSLRAVAGVALAGSLIVGGLAAFADEGACGTWTDKKGDSTTGQEGVPGTEDSQLDIVSASFDTVGDSIVGTITTAGLSAGSSDSGDEFAFDFTVAGVHMLMYVDRTAFGGQTLDVSAGFFNQSVKGAPTGVVTAKFDVKTKTVTLTGKISELAKSAAKPVAGQAVTKLSAVTSNHVDGVVLTTYDDAPAPATVTPVVGVECGGGGAAPAPSAASASASPSPSSSAPASGSPAPPTASGGDPLTDYPVAGCSTFKDPKGDASYNNTPNDPDLDMTALTLRTTGDALVSYIKVDKLAAKPSLTDGHRFYSEFTFNGHPFSIAVSQFSSYGGSVRDGVSQSGQAGKTSAMTVDSVATDTKVTSKFDIKGSMVVLSVPLAAIEKFGKAPVADATFTLVKARAGYDSGVLIFVADTVQPVKPDEDIYVVGDNHCFAVVAAAPAGAGGSVLNVTAPSRVQTSDVQTTSISLKGSDGQPVSGGVVTAQLGTGQKVAGRTNASGALTLRVPVTGPGATRTLIVSYAGGAGAPATTVRRATTVLAERSLLNYKVSGTGDTRQVTVTLTDDDSPTRHPYAGTTVTFAYSGQKVTATTDKAGQAIIRVKTGTKMDMTYAGKPGYITSALRQTTVS